MQEKEVRDSIIRDSMVEDKRKVVQDVDATEAVKNETEDKDNQVAKVAALAVVADTEVNPFVSSVSIGDLGGEDG
jgi:hypothetical protein